MSATVAYVAYSIVAALIGAGLIGGAFALYRGLACYSSTFFALVVVWATGIGGTALAAGVRPLTISGEVVAYLGTGGLFSLWSKRLLTVTVLALALVQIGRAIPRLIRNRSVRSPLLAAYAFLFTTNVLLNAVGGTQPAFVQQLYYVPIVIVAIMLQEELDLERVLHSVKWIVGLVLVGSLMAIWLFPDWATWPYPQSLIPGIRFRLAGLTPHPNALGPLAALYLVLEYYRRSPRAVRATMVIVAGCALALSQSKTAWIATVVAFSMIAFTQLLIVLRESSRSTERHARGTGFVVLSSFILFAFSALVLVVAWTPIESAYAWLTRRLPTLTSLTGRTVIWDVTIAYWRENPLFGYGSDIWGPEFRTLHGLPEAGQAHNQLMQTLGEAGLVGIMGLTVYVVALFALALKRFRQMQGLPLVLVVMLVVRMITEAPLRNLGVIDGGFFMHLLVILVLVARPRAENLVEGANPRGRFDDSGNQGEGRRSADAFSASERS